MKYLLSTLLLLFLCAELTLAQGGIVQKPVDNNRGLEVGVYYNHEASSRGAYTFKTHRFEIYGIQLPGETVTIPVSKLKPYGIPSSPLPCTDCSVDVQGTVNFNGESLPFSSTFAYGREVTVRFDIAHIEEKIRELHQETSTNPDPSEWQTAWVRMAFGDDTPYKLSNFRGATIDRLEQAARAYLTDQNKGSARAAASSGSASSGSTSATNSTTTNQSTYGQSDAAAREVERQVENTVSQVSNYVNHYREQKARNEAIKAERARREAEERRVYENNMQRYQRLATLKRDEYRAFLSRFIDLYSESSSVSTFSDILQNSEPGDTVYFYPISIDFDGYNFNDIRSEYDFSRIAGSVYLPDDDVDYNYFDNREREAVTNLGKSITQITLNQVIIDFAEEIEKFLLAESRHHLAENSYYESNPFVLTSRSKADLQALINLLDNTHFPSIEYGRKGGDDFSDYTFHLRYKVPNTNKFYFPKTADEYVEAYKYHAKWLSDYEKNGWENTAAEEVKPIHEAAKEYYITKAKELYPDHAYFVQRENNKAQMDQYIKEQGGFIKIIDSNHFETIDRLYELGFDVDYYGEENNSNYLHYSVWHNKPNVAAVLVKHGAWLERKSTKGYTPLFEAVRFRNHTIAEILLKAGADQNTADKNNNTAIIQSIYNKDLKMLNLLLAYGADPSIKNRVQGPHADYGNRMFSHLNALHTAVALKFPEGIRAIINKMPSIIDSKTDAGNGSRADDRNYEGVTALHLTSVYTCVECVPVLMEGGARTDIYGTWGPHNNTRGDAIKAAKYFKGGGKIKRLIKKYR